MKWVTETKDYAFYSKRAVILNQMGIQSIFWYTICGFDYILIWFVSDTFGQIQGNILYNMKEIITHKSHLFVNQTGWYVYVIFLSL